MDETEEQRLQRLSNGARHRLMYGLIYPGVVGAGMLALALRFVEVDSLGGGLKAFILCVVYIVIFAASFVASASPKKYGVKALLLDVFEATLVFVGLVMLGYAGIANTTPNISAAYCILGSAVLSQLFWRSTVGRDRSPWEWLRGFVAVLFFIGAWISGRHYGWHIAIALVTICATFVYILRSEWLKEQE